MKRLIEKKLLIPIVPLNVSKLHKIAIEKSNNIINELFDGVDDLSEQNYQYTITGSSDTFSIKAKHKTSNCTLTLNEKSKLSTSIPNAEA